MERVHCGRPRLATEPKALVSSMASDSYPWNHHRRVRERPCGAQPRDDPAIVIGGNSVTSSSLLTSLSYVERRLTVRSTHTFAGTPV
jgi:hypothetical protein